MQWTTETPTQNGMYCARLVTSGGDYLYVVHIVHMDGQIYAIDTNKRMFSLNSFSAWLGPLPPESQPGNKPPNPRHAQPL